MLDLRWIFIGLSLLLCGLVPTSLYDVNSKESIMKMNRQFVTLDLPCQWSETLVRVHPTFAKTFVVELYMAIFDQFDMSSKFTW